MSLASEDVQSWLPLVVGLLLVANPLYLPVAELASPEYVYERATISADGDILDYEAGLESPIHGVDCFEEPSYDCTVQRALVEDDLSVERRPADGRDPDPFVALPSGWYRRTVTERDGEVTYGLERVSAGTVLREVAVEPGAVPDRLRPAARGDSVRLDSRLEETYVVRDDGRTYYLTLRSVERPPLGWAYRPLSGLAVVAGAALLVWPGRKN